MGRCRPRFVKGTGTVRSKRALICSYYLPQPDVDTSSRRLLHFANFLVEDGWEVVVAAKNAENIDRCSRSLRHLGIAIYPFDRAQLEQLLATQTIDLALLAFWHIAEPMINVIRRASPQTRIVVDSMDLHFVRNARRVFGTPRHDQMCPALDANWASEMIRETNVYAASDAVLAVSQKEADFVNDLVGRPALAHAVPICEDLRASDATFAERRGMVFIGNFEHAPNVDALRYLRDEIVPQLDPGTLDEHPLYIVGSHMTPAIESEARAIEGARVVGWVPSVVPYLETARITVIPLRYGAGTKGKLIQSALVGTHFSEPGAKPNWLTTSGSRVIGTLAARCTVNANAIDWVKLSADNSGTGVFNQTTFIQRLNTVGGLAPTEPGTVVGQEAKVPYTADYYFYHQ